MSRIQLGLILLPLVVVGCLFLFSKRKWFAAATATIFCLAWGGVIHFYYPVFDATYMPLIVVACFLVPWLFLRHKRIVAIAAAIFCVVWCAVVYFYQLRLAEFILIWLFLLAICSVALWPVALRNKPGCMVVAVALCIAAVVAWLVGEGVWILRVAGWLVPLLVCTVAWPTLRRNRAWVVVAAVVCLTPTFVLTPIRFEFWPLVLAPLVYLGASAVLWVIDALAVVGLASPAYLGASEILGVDEGLSFLSIMLALALPAALPIGVIAWLLCEKYLPPPSSPSANGEAGAKPRPVRDQ